MASAASPLAVCYLRVSTRSQADSRLGLEAQRTRCRKLADHRLDGWRIEWIEEVASGGEPSRRRPGLAQVLQRLDEGHVQALVISGLDRASRRAADLLDIVDRANRHNWRLLIDELDVDTGTPIGRAILGILGAVSELERSLIRERTSRALAEARRRGVRLGRPTSIPAEVLAEIRDLRAEGLSLQRIANRLNEGGVPTAQNGARWHRQTVSRALRTEALNRAAAVAAGEWQGSLFE